MCIEEEKKVWTPPQLVEELKQRVIGQDEYLKDPVSYTHLDVYKRQRLYGIAETLEPLPHISNDAVTEKVLTWTREYLSSKETDLVQFFKEKITELKSA